MKIKKQEELRYLEALKSNPVSTKEVVVINEALEGKQVSDKDVMMNIEIKETLKVESEQKYVIQLEVNHDENEPIGDIVLFLRLEDAKGNILKIYKSELSGQIGENETYEMTLTTDASINDMIVSRIIINDIKYGYLKELGKYISQDKNCEHYEG